MATQEDRVDVGKIFTIGIVGSVIAYAMVVVAQFVYFQLGEAEYRKKNSEPPNALASYLDQQQTELAGYGWADKDNELVQIPIEQAIALTAKDGGALPMLAKAEVAEDASPAELGKALYTSLGCNACHSLTGERVVGPSFKGIWGEKHKFTDGSAAVVDLAYVKSSVLYPQQKIVETDPPVMPAYEGRVEDEDLGHIAAFSESLK